MHNDVDEICSGSNPFVTMILRGGDGPNEKGIKEVQINRCQNSQLIAKELDNAHEQIEELTYEKNRVFTKLEVNFKC